MVVVKPWNGALPLAFNNAKTPTFRNDHMTSVVFDIIRLKEKQCSR